MIQNTQKTIYFRNKISKYFKGILFVLNDKGEIFEGNSSFYEVWKRLNGSTVDRLLYEISDFFSIPITEIQNDVIDILHEMQSLNLIKNEKPSAPISTIETDLINAQIAITECCNLHCDHCYLPRKNRMTTINYNSVIKILNELQSIGILLLEISGGEPLLHPDIESIIKISKQMGFYIKLFTNGTLINNKNSVWLNTFVDEFRISLDGTEDTHNLIRGSSDAFRRTCNALDLLNGKPIQISMAVSDINMGCISDVALIAQKYGVLFEVSPVLPFPILKNNFQKNIDINRSLLSINEWSKKKDTAISNRYKLRGPNCSAGTKTIYISYDGEVYPCPLLSFPKWKIGNFYKTSIEKIIASEKIYKFIKFKNKILEKCNKCKKCQFWCLSLLECELKNNHSNNNLSFCMGKNQNITF